MTDLPIFTAPAACAESDSPDDWHPPSGRDGITIAARAKAVCATCPALQECREYAIPRAELHGLWGGLSTGERAKLRGERPKLIRQRSRCNNDHLFTPDNTTMTARGRRCRTCHNRAGAESKRRAS